MILVTGATGITGHRVARRLSKWGIKFSALVGNSDSAPAIKSSKIELVRGDLSEPDSLRRAMDGIEHAFLLTPDTKDRVKLEKNFIDAARETGVRYVVKYSAIGADPGSPSEILRQHGESEKYLEQSGIAYSIVRPSLLMQNFTSYWDEQIRENREFRLPFGDARCGWVDVRDVGRLIAKVLTENGRSGSVLTVTGPESLGCGEIAGIFSNTLGKKVKYADVKPKEFRKDMLKAGASEQAASDLTELYKLAAGGLFDVVTDTFYEVTERQPRTFEEFVDDNLSLFLKKKSKSKK